MIETILKESTCIKCGKKSKEIIIDTGICIACAEKENYEKL